jgi:hypothetical protein
MDHAAGRGDADRREQAREDARAAEQRRAATA